MKERFEINRKIRSLLVRHFVDIGELKISISPQRIMLRGRLVKLSGAQEPITADNVGDIVKSIKRLPEVHKVYGDLDNWKQDLHGGPWIPVTGKDHARAEPPSDDDAETWEGK